VDFALECAGGYETMVCTVFFLDLMFSLFLNHQIIDEDEFITVDTIIPFLTFQS
jgi:hypothetical protein